MIRSQSSGLFLLAVVACTLSPARAQEATSLRANVLEQRISTLEQKVENLPNHLVVDRSDGAALFLYGCFCALWAQNTNRNPWLWFFLGLFFSVITAVVLLAKNAGDRRRNIMQKSPGNGLDF